MKKDMEKKMYFAPAVETVDVELDGELLGGSLLPADQDPEIPTGGSSSDSIDDLA